MHIPISVFRWLEKEERGDSARERAREKKREVETGRDGDREGGRRRVGETDGEGTEEDRRGESEAWNRELRNEN